MGDIKLQPVGQMQQAQPAQDQVERLPSYSERYYDDYFEYRCVCLPWVRRRKKMKRPSASTVTAGYVCRHVSLTMEQAQRLPKPMRLLSEVRLWWVVACPVQAVEAVLTLHSMQCNLLHSVSTALSLMQKLTCS